MTPDPEAIREWTDKFGHIKKNFLFMAKCTLHKQSKRTIRNCKINFSDYITDRGLIALVCKELLKVEKTNNLRNWLNLYSQR